MVKKSFTKEANCAAACDAGILSSSTAETLDKYVQKYCFEEIGRQKQLD